MISPTRILWPRVQPLDVAVVIGTAWPWGWSAMATAILMARREPTSWLRREVLTPYDHTRYARRHACPLPLDVVPDLQLPDRRDV